jgi:hypothetical protein
MYAHFLLLETDFEELKGPTKISVYYPPFYFSFMVIFEDKNELTKVEHLEHPAAWLVLQLSLQTLNKDETI